MVHIGAIFLVERAVSCFYYGAETSSDSIVLCLYLLIEESSSGLIVTFDRRRLTKYFGLVLSTDYTSSVTQHSLTLSWMSGKSSVVANLWLFRLGETFLSQWSYLEPLKNCL